LSWTLAPITCLVLATLLLLGSIGLLMSGGAVLAVDNRAREEGYLTTEKTPISTGGYALTTTGIDPGLLNSDSLLGQIRLRAESTKAATPVFLGIARPQAAADYLSGVEHATITEIADPATAYVEHAGGPPELNPGGSDIWAEQATGPGSQSVSWPAGNGPWTVVIMNADGAAGIEVNADIGATVPVLPPIGIAFVAAGLFAGLTGAALAYLAIRLARNAPRPVKGRLP
jgi:hypothetical protein